MATTTPVLAAHATEETLSRHALGVSRRESVDFARSIETNLISDPVTRRLSKLSVSTDATTTTTAPAHSPSDFELLCVIGQGAFGKVIQVRYTPTGEIYAMKIVSKEYLVKKNSIANMQTERDIMTKVSHPFLISLQFAFQTTDNVFLVMQYVPGGELFHTLSKQGLLLERTACFYAAEMVLALEYLHGMGIIHRDLKPENILLDADGHVCLTDFGLSKELPEANEANTVCGTNEYMAPEMIRGNAYNHAVDWWALGALIYEMVTGYPPFRHNNRKKLLEKILQEKLKLPKWLSPDTHSILKQLLERNVEKRLGSGKSTMFQVRGVAAIKKHPFFKDIDWGLLERKRMTPPVVPSVTNSLDTSCFADSFTKMKATIESGGAVAPESPLFRRFSFTAADRLPTTNDVDA
ncbi:AGC protein kinase [Saprolegnia parasitica CBS 223.65]|uniref:AGC protein kinase n=1 Tax=Saprolegnia parasitica (strain CBS 223.65) TaxID=695850 RepID=A0A067CX40_SAPPC|nr:AGC protein kinase [Saprolegnia parasitica CBS 223.65]KDO33815.1 AGC protein kinase [Saprolegnia parasitica CBS 223.65]|eukprot:XP_012195451.1 AGC protein kinase [Saprolegnia parasitica CBS 223.65]